MMKKRAATFTASSVNNTNGRTGEHFAKPCDAAVPANFHSPWPQNQSWPKAFGNNFGYPAFPSEEQDPYYMARMQQNWALFGMGPGVTPSECTSGQGMSNLYCPTWWNSTNRPAPSANSPAPSADMPLQPVKNAPQLPPLSDGDGSATAQTTVMLRDIPCRCTQQDLLSTINEKGFQGKYDFFYLPIDFRKRCSMGYAFINFSTSKWAREFMERFHDLRLTDFSEKRCRCSWAARQGWEANVEVYRNGTMNRDDVPMQYAPLVFNALGEPQHLPEPDVPREWLPRIQLNRPRHRAVSN